MKRSENIIEIAKAINLAQREMKPAAKDSTNPHYRSKYSDLASVMEAIREPIGNNGLSIMQEATLNETGVSVTTLILHTSGQWIEFDPLTIPLGKKDAHAVGSACSYGKRYSLCAALGVVSDDDDDGNKAVESHKSSNKVNKVATNCDSISTPEPEKENIVKYINHFQMKIFNEKYNLISNPSSEYYDEKTCKMIDQAIESLQIDGFPNLEKMKESDWMRFMKSFDKHFAKKKNSNPIEEGIKGYAVN